VSSSAPGPATPGHARTSHYAAFGNKERLFRKALDRYQAGPQSFVAEALKKPTARAVVDPIFWRALADRGAVIDC
jgi:hypothetical protein